MKTFLDDQFAPITSTVGFFETSLDDVSKAMHQWMQTYSKRVAMQKIQGEFPATLHMLEPLTSHLSQRHLLLATDSKWTAYFNNFILGTDPISALSYLCEKIECRGLKVTCIPDTYKSKSPSAKGRYGAVQFEMFASKATEFLNYERTIGVTNDGGRWVFDSNGTPQSFERSESYTARRIKDRFTVELLEEYCNALAVRYFDVDFYKNEGYLIEILDPLTRDAVRRTLSET